MAETTRLKIPYPDEYDPSWFGTFSEGTMAFLDAALYAAREDRNLFIQGGGTMQFVKATGQFTWSKPLRLFSYQNAYAWFIQPAAITLPDGQVMYVKIPRGPGQNMVVPHYVGAPPLPEEALDTALVIGARVNDRIYFRNGMVLLDGDSFPLIEGGGRAAIQEATSLLPTMGLGSSQI